MDTSEQYIKLCERAEEIQKLRQWRYYDNDLLRETREGNFEEGDYIWVDSGIYLIGGDCYEVQEYSRYGLEIASAGYCEGYGFNVKKVIWLPRQDELQEMVDEGNVLELLSAFDCFIYTDFKIAPQNNLIQRRFWNLYVTQFTSMEQLWLAFVMKEKYNKTWENGKWI